jgi:hypothetical protein
MLKIFASNAGESYASRMLRRLVKNPNDVWARKRLGELVNSIADVKHVEGQPSMTVVDRLIEAAGTNKNVTLEGLSQRATKLGSTNETINDLAESARLRSAIRLIDDVNIGPSGVIKRPFWWTSPEGKLVTQFKSYTFTQTRMVKEEFKKSTPRALAKMLAVYYPSSLVANLVTRLIGYGLFGNKTPESEKEFIWDFLIEPPLTLGLAGMYYQIIRRAASPITSVSEAISPAALSFLRPGEAAIEEIASGKFPPTRTIEETINLLPFAGRIVAGHLRRHRREKPAVTTTRGRPAR